MGTLSSQGISSKSIQHRLCDRWTKPILLAHSQDAKPNTLDPILCFNYLDKKF
jgi:hypothetical protein